MMRTLILTIVLTFVSVSMYGQEKTYEFYVHKLDSLKAVYSVEDAVSFRYSDSAYFRSLFENNNLSDSEQLALVERIGDFYKQKEYIGLYYFARILLRNMYDAISNSSYRENKDDEKVRQRIVYILMDRSLYTGNECLFWGDMASDYNTDSTKNRIKEFMRFQLPLPEEIKEIKIRGKEASWNRGDPKFYDGKIAAIMKATGRKGKKTYNYLNDSIKMAIFEEEIMRPFVSPDFAPLNSNDITMVGSLRDTTFIPYLKEYMIKYPRQKRACTYALAKLGVQEYIDAVYAETDIQYEYLGTQEAYLKYLEKNFVWDRFATLTTSRDDGPRPFAILSMYDALSYIRDIPSDIWREVLDHLVRGIFTIPDDLGNYDPLKDEVNKDAIEAAYKLYNWILENQDAWEMRPSQNYFISLRYF